ncbi:hypothetical protein LCGC14_1867290 [marine sediment metagenome]|uniref:Uncharacterized protein n=1 Tax=marine sediment metagenome TaxID=412755 RepID=A0A0F9J4R9_9ZZZZ
MYYSKNKLNNVEEMYEYMVRQIPDRIEHLKEFYLYMLDKKYEFWHVVDVVKVKDAYLVHVVLEENGRLARRGKVFLLAPTV